MSKYKLYGAKIKKDKIDSTGTTDQGQNIEPIIKEMVDSNLSTVAGADISNLEGVDTTGASNGDVLVYDQSAGEWKPDTINSSNITEGTLNQATSNRTVDMGGNSLTINSNDGTFTGDYVMGSQDFSLTTLQSNGNSTGIFTDTAANSLLSFYSQDGNYRLGASITSQPRQSFDGSASYIPKNLIYDNVGYLQHALTSAFFVSDTNLNPASPGNPTLTEVETYISNLFNSTRAALKNRILYYTGTDISSDPYTHAYYFTGDNKLFELSASSDEKLVRYLTINIPYATIDTNNSNKIIGSVAVPQDLHINGDYEIKTIKYHCVFNGGGTNTVPITLKDASNTLASFTANAMAAGGSSGLSGVFLTSNFGRVLYLEAGTVTGAIEHLSVTLTIG